MINITDFTRVNNCVNGNPRYVLHYLALSHNYYTAVALAHECGGKAYKGKDYGGGIVFSTYSLPDLIKGLEHSKLVGLPVKATVRNYKGDFELFYYDGADLVAWSTGEGHSPATVGYYKKTKPLSKTQAMDIIKDYNKNYNANLVYSSRLSHN